MEEWRALQAQATLELCLAWFDRYQEVVAAAQLQHGEASHYRRRRPVDCHGKDHALPRRCPMQPNGVA